MIVRWTDKQTAEPRRQTIDRLTDKHTERQTHVQILMKRNYSIGYNLFRHTFRQTEDVVDNRQTDTKVQQRHRDSNGGTDVVGVEGQMQGKRNCCEARNAKSSVDQCRLGGVHWSPLKRFT